MTTSIVERNAAGIPRYETIPSKVIASPRRPLSQQDLAGFIISPDEALRLTQDYMARAPMWVVYNDQTISHPGTFVARLVLTNPTPPESTAYILTADTPEEFEVMRTWFKTHFIDYSADPEDPVEIEHCFIPPETA